MTKAGFRTDTGMVRGNNEDAMLVLPSSGIYAVADGVGGHNSGEWASRKAVGGVERFVRVRPVADVHGTGDAGMADAALMEYFLRCFREINAEILALSLEGQANRGMATTLVLAHVHGERLYVVNVGDSRAYIVRNGGISQITIDHTVVNRMVSLGDLTAEEARFHPRKNEITRALGAEESVLPDFFVTGLVAGDRVLLCSDGLHGELSDGEICGICSEGGDLNRICESLVAAANRSGGRDNISVICVEIDL
ncbi:MAG: Stp1/IreP family PP2C-type Ser/Thr phosphatase [Clostridiales Family XIII bacterium]|jgi:protein phosphatase|nr:Stp1/IreP family PP2C-type Ser/Thr phosphatase [Clostridiales Family XIII bacterium]